MTDYRAMHHPNAGISREQAIAELVNKGLSNWRRA